MAEDETYDPRYLAGIVLFNQGDYFEAHEVLEQLWMDTAGPDRQFFQGLIQVAVGLCHFGNGNVRGAIKLYHSSRDYLKKYPSPHFGLDLERLRRNMETCFAQLLAADNPDRSIELDMELTPTIELDPPPESWPDPAVYLQDEE